MIIAFLLTSDFPIIVDSFFWAKYPELFTTVTFYIELWHNLIIREKSFDFNHFIVCVRRDLAYIRVDSLG